MDFTKSSSFLIAASTASFFDLSSLLPSMAWTDSVYVFCWASNAFSS